MFKSNREYDRLKEKTIELIEQIKNLNKENTVLKKLREEEAHNNVILVNENKKITMLLDEIIDKIFYCPIDSEKIVLNKIKELVHDYELNSIEK